jgi:hypothetical protein
MFAYLIPSVDGRPINVWGGILLAVLVIFQVLVGTRVIKLPFAWHRVNGFVILVLVLAHGFLGYMVWFHGWGYKI